MFHLNIDIKKIWESLKGSEIAINYVHLLYYKCHKINPNRGGSYIDSSNCIKSKKGQQ